MVTPIANVGSRKASPKVPAVTPKRLATPSPPRNFVSGEFQCPMTVAADGNQSQDMSMLKTVCEM